MSPFATAMARDGAITATAASASRICCTAISAPRAESAKRGSRESSHATGDRADRDTVEDQRQRDAKQSKPACRQQCGDAGPAEKRDQPIDCEERRVKKEPRDIRRDRRGVARPWVDEADERGKHGEEQRQSERAQATEAQRRRGGDAPPPARRFVDQGERRCPNWRRTPEHEAREPSLRHRGGGKDRASCKQDRGRHRD